MNWDQVAGRWQQFTGQVKSRWAKLTDDDAENVAGKKEQLIGKARERYGGLKEEADKQVDDWISKLSPTGDAHEPSPSSKPNAKNA